MKKKMLLIPFIFSLFLVTACNQVSLEPREINPEVDKCVICNMSIVHETYATQTIMKNGDSYIFDDIGCMFEFFAEQDEADIGASHVRDVETEEWIPLEEAFFVYDASLWTPMAYGVVSFADEERAKAFIEEEGVGRLISLDELYTHQWGIGQ